MTITCLLLAGLGIAGIRDRHSLAAVVESGGFIDVGTMVLWVAAGVLALGIGAHQRRTVTLWLTWGALGGLFLFFAGEEIAWGTEFSSDRSGVSSDIHNRILHALVETLTPTGALFVAASVVLIGLATAFALRRRWWLHPSANGGSLRLFGVVAVAWLVLTQVLDLAGHVELPYVTGQWILEESGEFLAAMAALVGLLAHLHEDGRRSGQLSEETTRRLAPACETDP